MNTFLATMGLSLCLNGIACAQTERLSRGPLMMVTPLVLDFGAVKQNVTATNTFLVENTGDCGLDMTATVSGPFRIVSGGTNWLELRTVGVVTITYTPSGARLDKEAVFVTGAAGARIAVMGSLSTARSRVRQPRIVASPRFLEQLE